MIFNKHSNILPDPTHLSTQAGQQSSQGKRGPGFASYTLGSSLLVQITTTRSGRTVSRQHENHRWIISIQYNQMLKQTFHVVQGFLNRVRSRSRPFYVVLPTHSRPQDDAFYNFYLNNNSLQTTQIFLAGAQSIIVDASSPIQGLPRIGDLFNIVDQADANHQSTYKVAAVQTFSNRHVDSNLAPNQLKIHLFPSLQRTTSNNSYLRFIEPLFKVYQPQAVQQVQTQNTGIYNYQLQLQEYSR